MVSVTCIVCADVSDADTAFNNMYFIWMTLAEKSEALTFELSIIKAYKYVTVGYSAGGENIGHMANHVESSALYTYI